MALVAGGVRVVFWFSIIALAYLAALAAGHAWLRTMTCVIAWPSIIEPKPSIKKSRGRLGRVWRRQRVTSSTSWSKIC